MTIRNHRDLEVWQAAMNLAVAAHKFATTFPVEYRFERASQVRRAAVSLPSNIAEGHGQRNDKIFLHICISLGSLAELEPQIDIAERLGLSNAFTTSNLHEHTSRTGQLLHGMRRSLAKRIAAKRREP